MRRFASLNKRAVIALFCATFLLCALFPTLRMGFHRVLWRLRRPASYQIKIKGSFSWLGPFERISCVEKSQLVSEHLLYGAEQNEYFNTGFLGHTELEMSRLFNLAAGCYFDCLVEFHDDYHYPIYFDFYPDFMLWIEVSEIDDIMNCPHFNNMTISLP